MQSSFDANVPVIQTFAVAIPESGPAGLVIRHMNQGELMQAVVMGEQGLLLRAEYGDTLVGMSLSLIRKHWGDQSSIQVLETDEGQPDQCWLVPILAAS